ncbi:hypothetical protein STEG23_001692, partial [Scotinomys teguina]
MARKAGQGKKKWSEQGYRKRKSEPAKKRRCRVTESANQDLPNRLLHLESANLMQELQSINNKSIAKIGFVDNKYEYLMDRTLTLQSEVVTTQTLCILMQREDVILEWIFLPCKPNEKLKTYIEKIFDLIHKEAITGCGNGIRTAVVASCCRPQVTGAVGSVEGSAEAAGRWLKKWWKPNLIMWHSKNKSWISRRMKDYGFWMIPSPGGFVPSNYVERKNSARKASIVKNLRDTLGIGRVNRKPSVPDTILPADDSFAYPGECLYDFSMPAFVKFNFMAEREDELSLIKGTKVFIQIQQKYMPFACRQCVGPDSITECINGALFWTLEEQQAVNVYRMTAQLVKTNLPLGVQKLHGAAIIQVIVYNKLDLYFMDFCDG